MLKFHFPMRHADHRHTLSSVSKHPPPAWQGRLNFGTLRFQKKPILLVKGFSGFMSRLIWEMCELHAESSDLHTAMTASPQEAFFASPLFELRIRKSMV